MQTNNVVRKLLATRELTVNMNGVEYDVLLIPRDKIVDIDYSECPELHPLADKNK